MYKSLLEIIKKIEGNILCVGLDDKLLEGFSKNNLVNVYTIYQAKRGLGVSKSKKRKTSSGRTISIKKLYKYFKKSSIDCIICNIEEVNDYLKYFIKDSIYLDKKIIYLYGDKKNIDLELLQKRYQRYHSKIEIKEYKDNVLLIIHNEEAKTNWLKNKLYFIKDTCYNLVEFISNVLTS